MLHAQEPTPTEHAPEPAITPGSNVTLEIKKLTTAERLKALKSSANKETLAGLIPLLAQPADRAAVRNALLTLDPFPAKELVELLADWQLAVRIGTLELLEEKAGGDFSYNPWTPPGAIENEGPLARWRQWSSEDHSSSPQGNRTLLSDDQRGSYLRDLLGQDEDKATRARHMLEADGFGSVAFLENFLQSTPALAAGAKARVRQAQYQIVLTPRLGPSSGEIARNLAFGSRDQLLSALASTKSAGNFSIPILRDFLENPDPLVRETAIDAILAAGGTGAVELVAPVLKKEPDVNVIHGALRRLKDIPGDPSAKLAASFLQHSDEDLLVSAIQTYQKLSGSGSSHGSPFSSSRSSATTTATTDGDSSILQALGDPRWRVRVAALEFVAGRSMAAAKNQVLSLLEDPDEFVRFAAMKAAATLKLTEALPKMKALFLADEAMIAPVLEAYATLKAKPDAEMRDHLAKSSPEARLSLIRVAETHRELSEVAQSYAADPNLDVSCATLRLLSADHQLVEDAHIASALILALRSNQKEKHLAVLDRLSLPKIEGHDPAIRLAQLSTISSQGEKTSLDPLYDGFLEPLGKMPSDEKAPTQVIPAAQSALIEELQKFAKDLNDPDLSFGAAMALAKAGYAPGYTSLLQQLQKLSTARKVAISEGIDEPSNREAIPLLLALMRDPVEEVRQGAAQSALSNDDAPAFVQMTFAELDRQGTQLFPHEIYGYRFESVCDSKTCMPVTRAWATKTLRDETSSASKKVLACIAIRSQLTSELATTLTQLGQGSSSAWVRRAAWHALGSSRPSDWQAHAEAITRDPSPYVRISLPAVVNKKSTSWQHHFDDIHATQDADWNYDSSSRNRKAFDPSVISALEKLSAVTEVSPEVRFEAMFALLAQGNVIDVDSMVTLLRQQPEKSNAEGRISSWFSDSAGKVGPGLRPLFAAIDSSDIDDSKLSIISSRLALNAAGSEKTPVTFASLASQKPADNAAQLIATEEEAFAVVQRSSLPVVFFYKPGCRECGMAREMLDTLKRDHPTLTIEEHNILEADAVVLNQALCGRFQVPSLKHNIAPAIFTQGGFLIRDDIQAPSLAALIGKTAETNQNDEWKALQSGEIEVAKEQVADRYQALTLPIVIGAGLLDGVNPCAFATIIFFLSYLQIARRTPREMLLTGVAFIGGVFLAYLSAGLLLYQLLATLHHRFAGIQQWLNPLFALLALLAAFLSFRDAARARSGRMDEMTLQLPGFLKDRIRGVIRTGARARRFVIAAFLAGVIISFLELACTGQVYAPIVYQIQQGKLDAMLMLVLYNLAFILPLVVIFLLAYSGLRSETLIALQKKHTFGVKIALGLLFLLLGIFILWGPGLLHG